MVRFMMFFLALTILVSQLADRVYLRTLTAKKEVEAVSVRDGNIRQLQLETQEIVNGESMLLFSKDALVRTFNYRPGKALEHINSPEIRKLFISEEYYDKFKEKFLTWSFYEFNVNNISIKEAVATDSRLIMAPGSKVSSARVWIFNAKLPVIDRGVGGTALSSLTVQIKLVYLGPEGGMGIYAVKLLT